MPLFKLEDESLLSVKQTSFTRENLMERYDLKSRFCDNPDAIEAGLFVVAEEYGEWEDSRRRIDLLAIDTDAKLVIIELKRTGDETFMDLQSVRYAAMVSAMKFEDVVDAHEKYIEKRKIDRNAR